MIIIDIGAHDGTIFSLPMALDNNHLVYAIEPIPELAEQIRSHQLPNLQVFCVAMGEQETISKFYVNKSSCTSSLLRANCIGKWQSYAEQLEKVATIEVPVIRLDAFIEQHSIAEVDLLKIDTQGYDFQVLKGAGDAIRVIKRIILEVQITPLYENGSNKDEIIEYLTNQGFRLISASSQTEGLEENLEFIRINRYPLTNQQQDYFDVKVPYIGTLSTPKNDHVGQLLEQGIFEGPEQAFLWLYLQPGDTFFDCGAHTGLFSCIAAKKLQNHGKIVGFEPGLSCINLYKRNLEKLGCNCFTALNVALSDTTGQAELYLGKAGKSAFSTLASKAKTHIEIGDEKALVELRCLDDIIQELAIDKVTLAKVDVEGWESFVLKGASKSIKAGKLPILTLEFTEANAVAAGGSTKELRSLIESFGYKLCRFDATNFRLVPEPSRLKYPYENLFAVMELEEVNHRLAIADDTAVETARDIIARWDIAVNCMMTQYSLSHEKQISQQLRQQTESLQATLEQSQLQSHQIQATLEQSQLQSHQIQATLEQAKNTIAAMESSKFWKIRTIWFSLKSLFKRTINLN